MNHPNRSQIARNRPRCVGCGKPAPYATEIESFRLRCDESPPEVPAYRGNMVVTRQTVERHGPDDVNAYGDHIHDEHTAHVTRYLWDGETYRNLYNDLFCTLRCALSYATEAHRAGFGRYRKAGQARENL